MKKANIPEVVIRRLSLYYRCLDYLEQVGIETVSSTELGERVGIPATIIRKDLSYFGELGQRGIGYNVSHLLTTLKKIFGTDKVQNIVVIGAGNLGTALANYHNHLLRNFRVVAFFDRRESKVGQEINGIPVYHIDDMMKKIPELGVKIAILAVPAEDLYYVVSILPMAGIKAILNFSPRNIYLPEDVKIYHADLSLGLQSLSYFVNNSE